jgi:hypothetical protein
MNLYSLYPYKGFKNILIKYVNKLLFVFYNFKVVKKLLKNEWYE